MLHEFLEAHGPELIDRCRTKVATRRAPRATAAELERGVPFFLAQLAEMLPTANPMSAAPRPVPRHDFTVDQVVHGYGDLCLSIAELALEKENAISAQEFGVLSLQLDAAIAGAVTDLARRPAARRADEAALPPNERLGVLAHEMRNHLNTAILALSAIKRGSVGTRGATATALDRSLIGMVGLVDRTLAQVRLLHGSAPLREVIEMGPLISEVRVPAALEASCKGCQLTVASVEPGLFVEADRHILAACVANLLQNAFELTSDESHVLLTTYSSKWRVLIDVEDECGGLPRANHRAVEEGLSTVRRAAEANGGMLYARTIPGRGSVFTIDLPQKKWISRHSDR